MPLARVRSLRRSNAAAASSGAYSAGQVAGKVTLAVLAVLVVVALVRRVKARSNTES